MAFRIQVKVIAPRKLLETPSVINEIRNTMRTKSRRDLWALFQKTIEGWSGEMNPHSRFGPVNFKSESHFGPRTNWMAVFTYSKKYKLVND